MEPVKNISINENENEYENVDEILKPEVKNEIEQEEVSIYDTFETVKIGFKKNDNDDIYVNVNI